jgi:hypothetical protein
MTSAETPAEYMLRAPFAKWLGVRVRGKPFSEFTLIAWEKEGKGPPVTRVGRDVIYSLPSAEKWLRSLEAAE